MSMLDQLLDMGFDKEKAEEALKATKETGIEAAINWLAEQQTTDGGEEVGSTVELAEDDGAASGPRAMSLKCDECGKLLKDAAAAELHAARTQHTAFSESVEQLQPLTEEERRRQVELLQARLREARALKEEKESAEKLESEKRRRLQGQELAAVKERARQEEMMKLAEEKKRDKAEEKAARQRVLDQIKQDREARRVASTGVVPARPAPVVAAVPAPSGTYDQSQLQIRLTDGSILKQSFSAREPLSAVRLWVQMNRTDPPAPFNLMTAFPKKVFSDEDMEAPLESLGKIETCPALSLAGLVPTASLVVCRALS